MNVKFERNSYLKAVQKNEDLNDDNKIFNHVKTGLQFKYVDVSPQKFNEKYSAKVWVGRKFVALPAVIWSGVVKTIYHLVKAILIGMIARLGDKKYLKVQFFHVARDLQESFGWVATLFNDKYGQYHIQESKFHKSCYNFFLENREFVSRIVKNESDRKKAIEIANKCLDIFRKDMVLEQVAESYYIKDDLKEALETINKVSDSKEKEDFISEIVQAYLDKGDREKVIEVASKYLNTFQKNIFLKQVAESYCDEGNLEKALEMKELIPEIARAHLIKGDREKAIKVINMLPLSYGPRIIFLVEVAQSYFDEDNLEKAFETLYECPDSKDKEKLISKIADTYLNKGDKKKAADVISILPLYSTTSEKFFK